MMNLVHHVSNPAKTNHLGSRESQIHSNQPTKGLQTLTSVQPARVSNQHTASFSFSIVKTRIVLDATCAFENANSLVNGFEPLLHGCCMFLPTSEMRIPQHILELSMNCPQPTVQQEELPFNYTHGAYLQLSLWRSIQLPSDRRNLIVDPLGWSSTSSSLQYEVWLARDETPATYEWSPWIKNPLSRRDPHPFQQNFIARMLESTWAGAVQRKLGTELDSSNEHRSLGSRATTSQSQIVPWALHWARLPSRESPRGARYKEHWRVLGAIPRSSRGLLSRWQPLLSQLCFHLNKLNIVSKTLFLFDIFKKTLAMSFVSHQDVFASISSTRSKFPMILTKSQYFLFCLASSPPSFLLITLRFDNPSKLPHQCRQLLPTNAIISLSLCLPMFLGGRT